MKAALEGADKALSEMKDDPQNGEAFSLFNPVVKGITAENFDPIEMAVKGTNIKTEVTEGKYDIYLRLGKLIEDSEACIILPGDSGTELEVMANLHFDKKLRTLFGAPNKPIIFVGEAHISFLRDKFYNVIMSSEDVYFVSDEVDAVELTDTLFKKATLIKQGATTAELEDAERDLSKNLLRHHGQFIPPPG